VAALIEEFGEGKGLREGLRKFIDFSLSASASNEELGHGVSASYRTSVGISFDEFVEPLRESGSTHNLYGSLRDVLSVKGRLPFNGQTLWVVVPAGGRTSAPTEPEYDRDAKTILGALLDKGICCRWIKP
jgi:hypothetical protein